MNEVISFIKVNLLPRSWAAPSLQQEETWFIKNDYMYATCGNLQSSYIAQVLWHLEHHAVSLNSPHLLLPYINCFNNIQKTFIALLILVLGVSIIRMTNISNEETDKKEREADDKTFLVLFSFFL